MKKITPFVVFIIIGMLIVPNVSFASWWNPISWFKKQNTATQQVTPVQPTTTETNTQASNVNKPVPSIKKVDNKVKKVVIQKQKTITQSTPVIKDVPVSKPIVINNTPVKIVNDTPVVVTPIIDTRLNFGIPEVIPMPGQIKIGTMSASKYVMSGNLNINNTSGENAYLTELKFTTTSPNSISGISAIGYGYNAPGDEGSGAQFINGIADITLNMQLEAHSSRQVGLYIDYNPMNSTTNPSGTTASTDLVYVKYKGADTGGIYTACTSGCIVNFSSISTGIRTLYDSEHYPY